MTDGNGGASADLSGRVALVTGASRGIGAVTARALAAAGARVIVTDIADVDGMAAEIGGLGLRQDVTSEADWIETMAFARAEAGGLDILVNNAGIFALKPLVDTSLEEWRHMQSINVEGVFLGCKHAIPLLAERASRWAGGGAIVNMSSIAGMVGGANTVCYGTSKGAVRLLTKSLAIEVASLRIRVNSVHPGFIETAMGDQAIAAFSRSADMSEQDMRDQFARAHALGHNGQPGHVADGIVFLASDRAAFITGTELVIDGGMIAQ
ncbi:hypothetical protein ASE00_16645 [Sphingomonas sp. Root710]|uniref:SDR family NAD(P)-dependent oxidoreductase n=1 Tax=Sphingomonas sp. Root710 TaxID=1736594 RepID=UPI0006F3492E|nr:glucose 1-dehydrogenase [Sphingomonas sp. Root710]KRB80665.1 hypothetical protein ASE00_16645 [Sphingomonas sp. Root710]